MKKTNILFILSDDQGAWALGCAGNEDIYTPNLDRLAEEGQRFINFFCTSPVCSPARASIVTGKIPSQHGIHDWLREDDNGDNTRHYLENHDTYMSILSEKGYRCGISGKWHLGESRTVQQGFDYWHVLLRGGGPYVGTPLFHEGEITKENRYLTDRITENALGFLDRVQEDDRPFCLNLHYTAPHSPWDNDQH